MNKKAMKNALEKLKECDAVSTKIVEDGIKEINMVLDWIIEEFLPCGIEFEISEYEEEDKNGNDIIVKEYYLIDRNTQEMYDLENEETYKIFKEVLIGK